MSEVVRDTQKEFWRPPAVTPLQPALAGNAPAMEDACDSCAAEFMVGARFCYVCGMARQVQSAVPRPRWTHYLQFHFIQDAIGLPLASLISFLIGVGCVIAALLIGAVYAVQNFADFQAIQFWRMQWLLAAIAAFVAGILLRRTNSNAE